MLDLTQKRSSTSGSLYDSLPNVSRVDFFISHSWSCPSWIKTLAFCHFLNLDLAIASSFLACLVAIFVLVLHTGSLSGVAQLQQGTLYASLLCWPMAVFLVAYLCGHAAVGRTSFWFDRICVDQSNSSVKAQTLQAIPAFVAESTQMLVLWDDSYFERLWCNYELSVHAKTAESPRAMQLVPMWISLWTLSWISLYTILNFLCIGQKAPPLDLDSRRSLFSSMVGSNFVPSYVYLLTAFPFSWFCIQKLKSHKLMLDQMANFDLRNAKCSVESDRKVIEEQVLQLFDEALEPPMRMAFIAGEAPMAQLDRLDGEVSEDAPLVSHVSRETIEEIRHITSYPTKDEVINQFNTYVRGPLRDSVMNSMGKEDYISFKLCILVSLPWWFQGLILVLGCDGRHCDRSAAYGGYRSVPEYMVTNAAMKLLLAPLVNALSYPVMLKTNHLVSQMAEGMVSQMLLGSACSAVAVFLLDHIGLYLCGILMVVVNKYSHVWLAEFVAGLTLLFWATWFLFRKSLPQSQRSLSHHTWLTGLHRHRAQTVRLFFVPPKYKMLQNATLLRQMPGKMVKARPVEMHHG